MRGRREELISRIRTQGGKRDVIKRQMQKSPWNWGGNASCKRRGKKEKMCSDRILQVWGGGLRTFKSVSFLTLRRWCQLPAMDRVGKVLRRITEWEGSCHRKGRGHPPMARKRLSSTIQASLQIYNSCEVLNDLLLAILGQLSKEEENPYLSNDSELGTFLNFG